MLITLLFIDKDLKNTSQAPDLSTLFAYLIVDVRL